MKTCYNRKTMVKLKQQVTSLELSKKLKVLGVKQKSAWYWYHLEAEGVHVGEVVHSTPRLVDKQYRDEAIKGKYEWDSAFISAFTSEEIKELLPTSADELAGMVIAWLKAQQRTN